MEDQIWEPEDGERLRRAREQKGIDRTTLARHACLSLRQLVQLEEGGFSHFYTPPIKSLAGRRAAAVLTSMPDRGPSVPPHQNRTNPTNSSSSSLDKGATESCVGAPGALNQESNSLEVRESPD